MAKTTVDELNYKLILDDKTFNKQVADAEKLAKQLNTSLTNAFQIKSSKGNSSGTTAFINSLKKVQKQMDSTSVSAKKLNRNIADLRRVMTGLNGGFNSNVQGVQALINKLNTAEKHINNLRAGMNSVNKTNINLKSINQSASALGSTSGILSQIRNKLLSIVSIYSMGTFVKRLIEVGAEFEKQRVALTAIVNDSVMTERIWRQIQQLALKSPFQFRELTTYAKQLSAYSIPAKDLFETTKMLADMSSGLGVGMDRLVLAYGQIKAASVLRGQEVRQLTEAGIPIIEELRKQFIALGEDGITAGQVFDKISRRLVPFEMVSKVFNDMTSEGGKFFQMQEIQAETLAGKWANLTDAWELFLGKIAETNSTRLGGAIDNIKTALSDTEKLNNIIKALAGSIIAFTSAQVLGRLSSQIITISKTVNRLGAIKGITSLLGAGGIVGAISAVVAALTFFIVKAATATTAMEQFNAELNKIGTQEMNSMSKAQKNLDLMKKSLDNAAKGSEAYNTAIRNMNSQYGEYLDNLLTEKSSIDDITEAYNRATAAIKANAKERFVERSMEELKSKFNLDEFTFSDRVMKVNNLTEQDIQAIISRMGEEYMKGVFDEKQIIPAFNRIFLEYMGKQFTTFDEKGIRIQKDGLAELLEAFRGYYAGLSEIQSRADRMTNNIGRTKEERAFLDALEKEVELQKERLKYTELEENKDKALENIEVDRLRRLIVYYSELAYARQQALGLEDVPEGSIEDVQFNYLIGQAEYYNNLLDELLNKPRTWRDDAKEFFGKLKSTRELKPQDEDGFIDYLEKLRSTYRGLTEDIERYGASTEGEVQDAKERAKAIKDFFDMLGFSLEDKEKGGAGNPYKEQTEGLKAFMEQYKLYMQMLDLGFKEERAKLFAFGEDYKGTASAQEYIQNLLRKISGKGNLTIQWGLGSQSISDQLRAVGMSEQTILDIQQIIAAADQVRNEQLSKSLDYYKEIEKYMNKNLEVQRQIEKITEMVHILTADGNLVDTAKASIIEGLIRQLNKLKKELVDLEGKGQDLASSEFFMALFDNNTNRYGQQIEKLNIIRDLYRELKEADKDMTRDENGKPTGYTIDINDKADIRKLQDRLRDLGIEFETLNGKIFISNGAMKKLFQEGGDGAVYTQKAFALVSSALGEVIGYAKQLAGALGEDGEVLQEMLSEMEGILKSSSWQEALIKLAVGVVTETAGFVNLLEDEKERLNDLNEELRLYLKLREDAKAMDESEQSTIFGSNSLSAIQGAIKNLNEYNKLLKNTYSNFGSLSDYMSRNTLYAVGGYIAQSRKMKWYESFDFWGTADKNWKNLFVDLRKEYKELFDDMGNPIIDSEAWEKALSGMYDYGSELHTMIEYMKMFEDANESLADSLESLFGETYQSITDIIIESVKNGSNALSSLSDVAEGVADNIASILSNNLIAGILEPTINEITKLIKDRKSGIEEDDWLTIMRLYTEGLKEVEAAYPAIAETIKRLYEASGVDFGLDSAEALRGVASGMTEEQSGLIVAYLNGIRVDTNFARGQREQIISLLQSMAGDKAPDSATYLKQIEAHTASMALSNEAILKALQSVIAISSGRSAIRVSD